MGIELDSLCSVGHFFSGFECECLFLKIIPVDHCSLYGKCYEYVLFFNKV